jgi:sialate O-acetylesterase
MAIEKNRIRIWFDHSENGLTVRGDELHGFAISGTDRRFVWADAVIEGNTVVVRAETVAAPAAVRYGWQANPQGNLYNSDGLPASPFRTDDWPGITADNK